MSAAVSPGVGARIGRLFGIVLVFVLLGPPIGAVVFMLAVAFVGMGYRVDLSGLTWIALFAMIYGIPFGYLIGGVPAAAAGLLVGIRQAFFGRTTWWLALAAGVLVGIGFQIGTGQPLISTGGVGLREQSVIMVFTCACTTLLCWAAVRGWYFVPPATGGPS